MPNSTVPTKNSGDNLTAAEVNNMVTSMNSKEDSVAGKGLSANDFTNVLKTKLDGIEAGATLNSSNATLLNRTNHTGTQSADSLTDGTTNKAFLATERTKLAGIATAATANDSDANLKARANHTGTQSASTISDFNATALLAAPAETTTTVGALVNAATAKSTPVDADQVGLMDSAASNIWKKLSWANIKATLKTYFDTLYATLVSPTFTGVPLAPTAATGTDTTQIATTAYVQNELDDTTIYFDEDDFDGTGAVGDPITVNALTLDSTPTNGSANGVTSDGVFDALAGKQATLVSATNIKTINGSTILGSGDLTVSGGTGSSVALTTFTANNTVESYEIDISSYTSTYKRIEIRFENWNMGSTGRDLRYELKSGGSYFDASSYAGCNQGPGGQTTGLTADYGKIIDNMKIAHGNIIIANHTNTAIPAIVKSEAWGRDGANGVSFLDAAWMVDTVGAITHIKLITSGTGFGVNIEAGIFTVIGHTS